MKAKKATKGLKKAQSILSAVVEKWIDISPEAQELLAAAEDSVKRALALMGGKKSLGSSSKAASRQSQTGHNSAERRAKKRFTDEARKKLSILAKKRWAVAKSRGARNLAG